MQPKKILIERAKANGSMARLNILISAAQILNCEANNIIEEASDIMIKNGLMLGRIKQLHNQFVKAADMYFKDFATMVKTEQDKLDMFEDLDSFDKVFRRWAKLDNEPQISPNPILEQPISVLELPTITHRVLFQNGIQTVGTLVSKTKYDLLKLPGFGRKSSLLVQVRLGRFNLKLKDVEPLENE